MNLPVEGIISVHIVDDELSIRETIAHHLTRLGYTTKAFASAEEFLVNFTTDAPDILITDLKMPGMNGLELIQEVKKNSPSTATIIVTAHADKDTAIQALHLGAFDLFEKPVSLEKVSETIQRTARYQSVLQEKNQLKEQLSNLSSREAKRWGIDAMIGKTKAMQDVIKNIRLLQETSQTTVLITGESGSGKELVARAIHFGSERSACPFIAVNCSAVPGNLAESELFGHTKGAFTGATANRKGCFEQAHTGTLFLDEIGDMPAEMQTKLLRVLEDGEITPVGSNTCIKVSVRVLAATNADLASKISAGTFRKDLYYRLARYTIDLPPLRERKSDIPLLVNYFLKLLSSEMGKNMPELTSETLKLLQDYSFPGNIRELKNLIEHAMIESRGSTITPAHLHFTPLAKELEKPRKPEKTIILDPNEDYPLNLKKVEATAIRKAMTESNGNVSAAARLLGINRTKLHRLLTSL